MRTYKITETGQFIKYNQLDFGKEGVEIQLEDWLEKNPHILLDGEEILYIGRQVTTIHGGSIDLIGVDRDGNTVIIELKRGSSPRDVIAQALEYVTWVEGLSYEELEQIAKDYSGSEDFSLVRKHLEIFSQEELSDYSDAKSLVVKAKDFNQRQKVVIVAQEITPVISDVVRFLRGRAIDISCVQFNYFKTESGECLATVNIIELPMERTKRKTDEQEFLQKCDEIGKRVYTTLLTEQWPGGCYIVWRKVGFSCRMPYKDRSKLTLFVGYPKESGIGQIIQVAISDIRAKVGLDEKTIENYIERLQEIFECKVNRDAGWPSFTFDQSFTDEKIGFFIEVIKELIKLSRERLEIV